MLSGATLAPHASAGEHLHYCHPRPSVAAIAPSHRPEAAPAPTAGTVCPFGRVTDIPIVTMPRFVAGDGTSWSTHDFPITQVWKRR